MRPQYICHVLLAPKWGTGNYLKFVAYRVADCGIGKSIIGHNFEAIEGFYLYKCVLRDRYFRHVILDQPFVNPKYLDNFTN